MSRVKTVVVPTGDRHGNAVLLRWTGSVGLSKIRDVLKDAVAAWALYPDARESLSGYDHPVTLEQVLAHRDDHLDAILRSKGVYDFADENVALAGEDLGYHEVLWRSGDRVTKG
jgi:hypothetical protein